MFWLSNEPNAPLHSDMIATLIGVPEPPLRGATAGCGSGALAGAAAAGVLVLAAGVDVLDELLLPPPDSAAGGDERQGHDGEREPDSPPARSRNECILISSSKRIPRQPAGVGSADPLSCVMSTGDRPSASRPWRAPTGR